jgi:dihydrofolate synthase / folylpolyglutamate synthase
VSYMPAIDRGDSPYTVKALGADVRVDSPLKGAHQHRNLALAIATAVELAEAHGVPITAPAMIEGIRQTRWPGRLERISGQSVEWILDVAHNPAGAWALRSGLRTILDEQRRRVLVFSCLKDKPAAEMAQILFPLFELVVLAPINTARATSMDELLAAAQRTGTPAMAAESVRAALRMAEDHAARGTVVVSGSVYLVGDARGLLMRKEK